MWTGFLDLREQINSLTPEDEKLSINDFVIKAAALALRKYPNLNASISGKRHCPTWAYSHWGGCICGWRVAHYRS